MKVLELRTQLPYLDLPPYHRGPPFLNTETPLLGYTRLRRNAQVDNEKVEADLGPTRHGLREENLSTRVNEIVSKGQYKRMSSSANPIRGRFPDPRTVKVHHSALVLSNSDGQFDRRCGLPLPA